MKTSVVCLVLLLVASLGIAQQYNVPFKHAAAAGGNDCSVESEYLDEILSYSPVFFVDAEVGVTTDVDGVNLWEDQSTTGADVAQATGSKEPDVTSAVQNGLDGIDGDYTDDSLTNINGFVDASADEITVFAVGLTDGDSSGHLIMQWGDGAGNTGLNMEVGDYGFGLTCTAHQGGGSDRCRGTDMGDETAPHIFECVYDADADPGIATWVDGTAKDTVAGASVTTLDETLDSISLFEDNDGGGWAMDDWLGAVVVFDDALDATDRGVIRECLNDRWAIY